MSNVQHSSDDVCCLCSDPDFFEAVERGHYPGVTAHLRWSEEFCPHADYELEGESARTEEADV